MSILDISDLSIVLPEGADRSHAVDGISLQVDRNEIVCLVGESGSGKSMIAHAILDLLPKKVRTDGGRILYDGKDILSLSKSEIKGLRGAGIAMIFQEPLTALNPLKKVGDQVAEAIRVHDRSVSSSAARTRVIDLFHQVGLPDPERLGKSFPFQLSGGQRQRVMIAMALSNNPSLLIADEPTTALDVTTQRQILDLIKELQTARGMGVLFITHDIGVVADIADRVVVLKQGKIVEHGPAMDVLDTPQEEYTRMLLDSVPGRGAVKSTAETGTNLLDIQGLKKTFVTRQGFFTAPRTVVASDNLNITLKAGDTLAVVGESGSGKSTLARLVLRLLEPSGGKILWKGQDVREMNREALRQFRRKAQIVFQDPYASLDPRLKIGQSIIRGPMAFGISRAEATKIAQKWLERVDLGAQSFDRFPHEFSGGQRQRICIARALALDPDLLIADEAVSALDVSVQSQVLQLLSDLKSEFGLSMLFITHDLRVAREIADHIIVMQNGRIVEQNSSAGLFNDPQEEYTRRLLEAVPGRAFFARQVPEQIAVCS